MRTDHERALAYCATRRAAKRRATARTDARRLKDALRELNARTLDAVQRLTGAPAGIPC